MKRKLQKNPTSSFGLRGVNHVNVIPVSSVEQELAVSRALSALCGGSGVGQAPEPPQRADSNSQFQIPKSHN